MRILFLTYYFEPDLGAGAFRNSSLLKEVTKLINKDDYIDVIASAPNRYDTYEIKAESKEDRGGNLSIYRVDLPKHDGGILTRAKTSIIYYKKVLSIAKKNDYDLVYASSSRLMTAFLGAKIANKNKEIKLYLDIRDIFRETISDVFKNKIVAKSLSFLFKYIEIYTYKRANHINLVSKGFESYFEKFKENKYTFFTNGIDDVFLNPMKVERVNNSSKEIKTIIYAGNIGEGQGLDIIIPKVAKVLESTHKFVIYGDGGTKYKLIKELKQNEVFNVDIFSPIGRDLLIEKYAEADYLFLHLNYYKAFERVLPSKLFEYGAFSKPIIAGVSGYPAEFLKTEMENLILFSPGDSDYLIEELKNHKFYIKKRDNFIDKYSRNKINQKMAVSIVNLGTN